MSRESVSKNEQWVVMFPGQGSQFVGMGKDFFAQSSKCKEIYELANHIAQKDITKLCFSGPISKLSKTDVLQISITATNMAISQYLLANTAIKPSVCLGHSVGEYSALNLAGSLSTHTALELALVRGSLMQREAKLVKGQMYAIKNLSAARLREMLEDIGDDSIVIANDNSNQQQVVSGAKSAISEALSYFSAQGIETSKLPVSGAWHSALMQGCVDEFARALEEAEINKPKIPYINNMTALPCTDVADIKNNLTEHITGMVRWRESIEWLIAQGHRNFVEVGPKKVLSRLIESIAQDGHDLTIKQVESIDDVDRFGC
ncbi:ACP S-malonyltransferase [Arenicella sp. 4NH20-0111]|uniref:ACP S-malonyltransferase n=1 Tax=Arenicella sp. 4NH20-0111 TaxID=3127648 RepID=UPI0031088A84